MTTTRADLVAFYEAYNDVCNRHAFSELAAFVQDRLMVNRRLRTREQYADDLGQVIAAFPDYTWSPPTSSRCTASRTAGSPRSG